MPLLTPLPETPSDHARCRLPGWWATRRLDFGARWECPVCAKVWQLWFHWPAIHEGGKTWYSETGAEMQSRKRLGYKTGVPLHPGPSCGCSRCLSEYLSEATDAILAWHSPREFDS